MEMMELLGLTISGTCKSTAEQRDSGRLHRQACSMANETKEDRTIARMERIKEKQIYEGAEWILYEAGMAD